MALVLSPKKVDFIASTDHATVLIDGSPLVQRYELVVVNAAGATVLTKDLGKPTPDALKHIAVTVAEFATLPVDTICTATVAAVGAAGRGTSQASNPFAVPGPARVPAAPGIVAIT